jgi:AcrR family transcriptional regulator
MATSKKRIGLSRHHTGSRRVFVEAGASEDKRRRLMESAGEAFLAHGYEGANLEEIAIAAGVGKLAIYRLFEDKSDLFAKVILHAVETMSRPVCKSLESRGPVEDVLCAFAESYAAQMLRPAIGSRPFYEVVRLLIGTSLTSPKLAAQCVEIFRRDLGKPLAAYMATQIDEGLFKNYGDGFLTQNFVHMLFFTNAVILDPSLAPKTDELRDLAKRTVSMFLHGCMAPGKQ